MSNFFAKSPLRHARIYLNEKKCINRKNQKRTRLPVTVQSQTSSFAYYSTSIFVSHITVELDTYKNITDRTYFFTCLKIPVFFKETSSSDGAGMQPHEHTCLFQWRHRNRPSLFQAVLLNFCSSHAASWHVMTDRVTHWPRKPRALGFSVLSLAS